MSTFGPSYDEKLDGARLRKQHERIRQFMSDGRWRTLNEIANFLGYPEPSVSAQLRHLRKKEFGSYVVDRRRRGTTGLWEYRVSKPQQIFDEVGQGLFFSAPSPAMRGH